MLSYVVLFLLYYYLLKVFFGYENWVIILTSLVLVPQIVHNLIIGANPDFNPYYIFGYVGTLLLLPIY